MCSLWRGLRGKNRESKAAKAKSAFAPKACGSSARSCGQIIWKKALDENLQVCPQCEYHFQLDARTRLAMLFDDGGYEELDAALVSTDPLQFRRFQALHRPPRCDAGGDVHVRRADLRLGQPRRPSRQHLRDGAEVHRRQHGQRGRRKDHPRHRTLHRPAPSPDYRFGLRRRAHAGRRHQPDAARQNFRRADAPG